MLKVQINTIKSLKTPLIFHTKHHLVSRVYLITINIKRSLKRQQWWKKWWFSRFLFVRSFKSLPLGDSYPSKYQGQKRVAIYAVWQNRFEPNGKSLKRWPILSPVWIATHYCVRLLFRYNKRYCPAIQRITTSINSKFDDDDFDLRVLPNIDQSPR